MNLSFSFLCQNLSEICSLLHFRIQTYIQHLQNNTSNSNLPPTHINTTAWVIIEETHPKYGKTRRNYKVKYNCIGKLREELHSLSTGEI